MNFWHKKVSNIFSLSSLKQWRSLTSSIICFKVCPFEFTKASRAKTTSVCAHLNTGTENWGRQTEMGSKFSYFSEGWCAAGWTPMAGPCWQCHPRKGLSTLRPPPYTLCDRADQFNAFKVQYLALNVALSKRLSEISLCWWTDLQKSSSVILQCFNYSENYLFYNGKCSWWVVTWGRAADGVLDAGFLHHIFLRIPALTWFLSYCKAAVTCPLVKCRPSWPWCTALHSCPLFLFPSRKCLGKRGGICARVCILKSTKILQGPFIFRTEYSVT